jgi:hypothetical protein
MSYPYKAAHTNLNNNYSIDQLPGITNTYSLGSTSLSWLNVYIGNGSFYQLITSSALSANYTFTLPAANSNPIQPLTSAASGSWVSYIDLSGIQHQVTASFANLSGSATLAQLPSIAQNTLLGSITVGTNAPAALTATQVTAMLNTFTSSLQGLVPSSGGGTANFLRADGTWAVPAGGSSAGVSSLTGTANQVTVSAATGAVTISLPSAITLPGSMTMGGTLACAGQQITGVNNVTPFANASYNLGSSTVGFANLYIGNSTFTTAHTTAALTANRTFTTPNANSTSVQPASSISNGSALGYIDANGLQNLTTVVNSIAGTTNQISVLNGSGAYTLSLPSAVVIPSAGSTASLTVGDTSGSGGTLNVGTTTNTTSAYMTIGLSATGSTNLITNATITCAPATPTAVANLYIGPPAGTSNGNGKIFLRGGSSTQLNFYDGAGSIYFYASGNTVATQVTPATPTQNNTVYLPNANSTTTVPLASATPHFYHTYTDSVGIQHTAQPSFSDLSGNSTLAQMATGFTTAQPVRVYLTSGQPYTDTANATTNFYVGPAKGGNVVYLPDTTGNSFTPFVLSEITTALPTGLYGLVDVFLYNNSGTPAVYTQAWQTGLASGTITGLTTAGNPIVLTSTGASSLTSGMLILIDNSATGTAATYLNGRVHRVVSATSASITLETGVNGTGLTWTGTGNWWVLGSTRATALVRQNGMYLQSGNLNRLYICTMFVGAQGTSARTDDSTTSRLVWNYFSRAQKYLLASDSAVSWTYAVVGYRARDNTFVLGTSRNDFVIGVVEEPIEATISQLSLSSATTVTASVNVQLNSIAAAGTVVTSSSQVITTASNKGFNSNTGIVLPILGYNFAQSCENVSTAATATFYGTGTAVGAATSSIYLGC